jgi:hypothetical protein
MAMKERVDQSWPNFYIIHKVIAGPVAIFGLFQVYLVSAGVTSLGIQSSFELNLQVGAQASRGVAVYPVMIEDM